MKKFIVFIIAAIILAVSTSFTAKAQFVGGDTTKERGEVIETWSDIYGIKAFGMSNENYVFSSILTRPGKMADGSIHSDIITLSLGKSKEECVKTLYAYKDLIGSISKYETREITDVLSGITYVVSYGGSKNRIIFTGGDKIEGDTHIHYSGFLSVSDIERMLKKI